MWDRDIIDIGLSIIKCCGMYSKEYKNWIVQENESPPIVKTINSFEEYWSGAIVLVNQTGAPASQSQHGYGIASVDNVELWRRVRSHTRFNEEPSRQPGRDAGPAGKHPAILHGRRSAAPKQNLPAPKQQLRP
jgi:hypothetical protein